jgi:hypothetical protein
MMRKDQESKDLKIAACNLMDRQYISQALFQGLRGPGRR